MNKVSVPEGADGSPPFWRLGQAGGFLKLAREGSHGLIHDHLCHAQSVRSLRVFFKKYLPTTFLRLIRKNPSPRGIFYAYLETQARFALANESFADSCVTTSPLRLEPANIIMK